MTGPGDKLREFMSRFIGPKSQQAFRQVQGSITNPGSVRGVKRKKKNVIPFDEAVQMYENKPKQELSVEDAKAISNFSNQVGNKSLAEQTYDKQKKKKKKKKKPLNVNITEVD